MATVTARPAAYLAGRLTRRTGVAVVIVGWLALFAVLRGRATLPLGPAEVTGLHLRLNHLNTDIGAQRAGNPLFVDLLTPIQHGVTHLVTFFQALISQPAGGRPLPLIGWLGVLAVVTWLSWVFGNGRVAALAAAGLLFIGAQGLWSQAMDTLALTLAAVLICLLIGIPLGVLTGRSRRAGVIITPVLDFMQTMPTFVYLAPLTVLFLIGPAAATIATLIYALPPVIRLTAHGIRSVPAETVAAATCLGTTRWQLLRTVLLPMAARTIVIGINQTIMAALAMVIIAALVGAPGLGQTVVGALESLDVGTAFNAGLAIVVLAVILDRVTTAAGERAGRAAPQPSDRARRRRLRPGLIGAGAVLVAVAVYQSYTYLAAARFPTGVDLGTPIRRIATTVTTWSQINLVAITGAVKNAVTSYGIDPVQALLDQGPWWLTCAAIGIIALIVGGRWAAVTTVVCLAVVLGTGLWQDSMDTLAATLLATAVVMVLGLAFGVWMGRRPVADRVLRPLLDAAQTMPAFVYLVPFVALFAASRFTGMLAAVLYAAPASIKIVADGIRGVPAATVEAATAAGATGRQVITTVQLPMAVRSVALATNQGLIYVLAMVVVGGLVGGGALGFDVVAGFSQSSLFGKGLAAGMAIVALGIMLDRITQAAARTRLRKDTG